jgi:hypothetical protein
VHPGFIAAQEIGRIRQGDGRGVEKSERVLEVDVSRIDLAFLDQMGNEIFEVLGITQGLAMYQMCTYRVSSN